ncbi:phosphate/phosphite/phosphonate ABC transporter substrate-binding protein [Thiovibrio sp. JS02]
MQRYNHSLPPRCRRLFLGGVRRCFAALMLTLLLAGAGYPAAKPEPVRIAITPCTDIMKSFKVYQPLAAYLERQIQQPVVLVIPQHFAEFERSVRAKSVEFTFQAPHTYVRLAHLYRRETLLKALTPEGKTRHRGVIIVRRDSPIKRIEDLKGKHVIFGAENDMAKSLSAKRLLGAKGIDPEKDLRGYKHNGSCESIALNVFLKETDAGAVCDYSFADLDEPEDIAESEIPPHQLRVLGETEEIPTWVFAALAKVDDGLVAKIITALTALTPENREYGEVLESAEVGGFIPAKDSDFDEVRKIVPMGR